MDIKIVFFIFCLIKLCFPAANNDITVIFGADDWGQLLINGNHIDYKRDWRNIRKFGPVASTALRSTNVVGIYAPNNDCCGGVIAEVTYAKQYSVAITIYSTDQWKGTNSYDSDWEKTTYSDSHWGRPSSKGRWGSYPWSRDVGASNSGITGSWPAHWMWYGSSYSPSYLRLNLPMDSFLAVVADGSSIVYLNTGEIFRTNGYNDMKKYSLNLRTGKNVIGIRVYNSNGGVAGMLAELTSKYERRILSGGCRGKWKSSTTYQSNWDSINFDDSSWNEPYVVAEYNDISSPWGRSISGMSNFDGSWIWSQQTPTTYSYFRLVIDTESSCPERDLNCGNVLGIPDNPSFLSCLKVVEYGSTSTMFRGDWAAGAGRSDTNEGEIAVYWGSMSKTDAVEVYDFTFERQNADFEFPITFTDWPGRQYTFTSCLVHRSRRECTSESSLRRSFFGTISGSVISQNGGLGVGGVNIRLTHSTYLITYGTTTTIGNGEFEVDFRITLPSELARSDSTLDIFVTVSSEGHSFVEDTKMMSIEHKGILVTILKQNPIISASKKKETKSEVSFIDNTTRLVSMNIKAEGTECPIESCNIIVEKDGIVVVGPHFTTTNGDFTYEAAVGSNVKLTPDCFGHTIVDSNNRENNYIQMQLQYDDIESLQFIDTTKYELEISVGGNCDIDLGDFDVLLKVDSDTYSECNSITISDLNSNTRKLVVAPLKYKATVTDSLDTSTDYKTTIIEYFSFKNIVLDMTLSDSTYPILYQPPINYEWKQLDHGNCGRFNSYIFKTIIGETESEDSIPLDLEKTSFFEVLKPKWILLNIYQEYVSFGICRDISGKVDATDQISANDKNVPLQRTVRFTNGTVLYKVLPVKASIDNPPQRNLEFIVDMGYGPETVRPTLTGIALGTSSKPGNDFTTQANVPFMVLRDPPGGNSYAEYSKGNSTTIGIEMSAQSNNGLEQYSSLSLGINDFEVNALGVEVGSLTFLVGSDTNMEASMAVNKDSQFEMTYEFTTEYKTSEDPLAAGPESDLIIGSGMNFVFGRSNRLTMVPNQCEIIWDETINFRPGGLATKFVHSKGYIEKVLIPKIEETIEIGERDKSLSEEEIRTKNQSITHWHNILAYVDELDDKAKGKGAFNSSSNKLIGEFEEGWNQLQQDKDTFLDNPVRFLDTLTTVKATAGVMGVSFGALAGVALPGIISTVNRFEQVANSGVDMNTMKREFDTAQIGIDTKISGLKEALADHVSNMDYSFNGGPSITESFSVSSAKSTTFNFDMVLDSAVSATFEMATMIHKNSGGSVMKVGLQLGRTMKEESTESSTVSVVFSDPDIGDSFAIDTSFDSTFGTPVFELVGGNSRCIHEEGTIALEEPSLAVDGDNFQLNLKEGDSAVFNLIIMSLSSTLPSAEYVLGIVESTNQNGLKISINGNSLTGNPVTYEDLEPATPVNVELVIERGSTEFEYSDIQLELYSGCEKEIGVDDYIKSVISLDVSWVQPCSTEIVWGSLEQTTFTKSIDSELASTVDYIDIPVKQTNYDSNPIGQNPIFKSLTLQYRPESSFGDFIDYQEILQEDIVQDDSGVINFLFDFTSLNDNIYDLRVMISCVRQEVIFLNGGKIEKSVAAPKIFGLPSPKPGQSYPLVDIFARFDKPLDCPNSESNGKVDLSLQSDPRKKFNSVFICKEEKIFITPALPGSYLELQGKNAQVSINGVEDNAGNVQIKPGTWMFPVEPITDLTQATVVLSMNLKTDENALDILLDDLVKAGSVDASRFSSTETPNVKRSIGTTDISISPGPAGSDSLTVLDRISKALENGELEKGQSVLDSFMSYIVTVCVPGQANCTCSSGSGCSNGMTCSDDNICLSNNNSGSSSLGFSIALFVVVLAFFAPQKFYQ